MIFQHCYIYYMYIYIYTKVSAINSLSTVLNDLKIRAKSSNQVQTLQIKFIYLKFATVCFAIKTAHQAIIRN